MRLSTDPDRDDDRGVAVIHAALEAGVALFDTADVYCRDHSEIGHNERLIARALASWGGDRSAVRVATKGGLTRPDGAWVEDGRAKHLRQACAASRRALGVERIHLYQLHAPDPRTPFSTSVRALKQLLEEGLVEQVGLCNVNRAQLEEARRVVPITTVQVELSLLNTDAILGGVVPYCLTHGIRVLAHRPLGGARRRKLSSDPVLAAIAVRHGATPHEIALAWLLDLSPLVVPLPGATRVETVKSIARAASIALTARDREELDARSPESARLREGGLPRHRPAARRDGEVVLVMGLPGAGKSTLARSYVERGYARLNRDDAGGALRDLLPAVDRVVAAGGARIVLDNTYLTRKSRAAVIDAAARRSLPVRCVWLTTSVEEAQVNVVLRMLGAHGRLLEPDEIRRRSRTDPAVFGPNALFRSARALEPPDEGEGFVRVEARPFVRVRDPAGVHRAVIVWCDGILLDRRADAGVSAAPTTSVSDQTLAARGARLRQYRDDRWSLFGLTWQPRIAEGSTTALEVARDLARMRDRIGVPMEVEYCPHAAGPPVCWCRKPLPGLGVALIRRYRLDPAQCLYIGAGVQDPGFARRLGFRFLDAEEFFRE